MNSTDIMDAGFLRDVLFAAGSALSASKDANLVSLVLASSGNSEAYARIPSYRAPTTCKRVNQTDLGLRLYIEGRFNTSLQLTFLPPACPGEAAERYYYYQPEGETIADAYACSTSPTVYPYLLNTDAEGTINITAWQCDVSRQVATVSAHFVQSPAGLVLPAERPSPSPRCCWM